MPPPRSVIDRQAPALDLGEIVDDLQGPIPFLAPDLIEAVLGEKADMWR
jgi:hypothetical protein